MATAPARRKHGACLLRIRENCPFRKLRKNRCYDITTSASASDGACWGDISEHSISTSKNGPISTYVEPLPPSYQSIYPRQSQDPIAAMDVEVVRLPVPALDVMLLTPPCLVAPGPLDPNLQPGCQHRDPPIVAPSEACMVQNSSPELDSGVDPETGERAQE